MSRGGCGLPIGLALGAALALAILAAAFWPGHPSTPAPALSEAGYYLLCGGPVALLLLAAALIRGGARLAGGFLAGLLLTLLAGLFLLAWLDVAGGAGGR
jgi:hypothetical protein